MNTELLKRAQAELSNRVAAQARADGDEITIHLLAAAELAGQAQEHYLSGHLLHLAEFRVDGRDAAVCGVLAPRMEEFHRVAYAKRRLP